MAGRYFNHADALAHARQLIDEGADIIDIGGESTRPGAAEVSSDEEIRRVVPLLEALGGIVDSVVSGHQQAGGHARGVGRRCVDHQ